jgi:hypothetical protein
VELYICSSYLSSWLGQRQFYFYALYVSCKYVKKISASEGLCCMTLKMELRIVSMEYTCINSVKKICYIYTFIHTHTHTHTHHRYIHMHIHAYHHIISCHILFPWIHKMTVGCGISYKHTKCRKYTKFTELWQGKVL